MMLNIFSCVCWPLACLPSPIFKSLGCLYYWPLSSLCILHITFIRKMVYRYFLSVFELSFHFLFFFSKNIWLMSTKWHVPFFSFIFFHSWGCACARQWEDRYPQWGMSHWGSFPSLLHLIMSWAHMQSGLACFLSFQGQNLNCVQP